MGVGSAALVRKDCMGVKERLDICHAHLATTKSPPNRLEEEKRTQIAKQRAISFFDRLIGITLPCPDMAAKALSFQSVFGGEGNYLNYPLSF